MSIIKVAHYYQVKLAMSAEKNYKYILNFYSLVKALSDKIKKNESIYDELASEQKEAPEYFNFVKKLNELKSYATILTDKVYREKITASMMRESLYRIQGKMTEIITLLNDIDESKFTSFARISGDIANIWEAFKLIIPMDMEAQKASPEERKAAEAEAARAFRSPSKPSKAKTNETNLGSEDQGSAYSIRDIPRTRSLMTGEEVITPWRSTPGVSAPVPGPNPNYIPEEP